MKSEASINGRVRDGKQVFFFIKYDMTGREGQETSSDILIQCVQQKEKFSLNIKRHTYNV